jgi:uncharacterized protein (TIGR00730 family)
MKSIAIFCGSQMGANALYQAHAQELVTLLAGRQVHIVYGGGKAGLMGVVADAALAGQAAVTGVIPGFLNTRERMHEGLTETIVTDSMHERKKLLFEKCDGAIILPGGFGTLDELFEMVTWNQLALHHKKVFFLNTAGFYNFLRQHIEHMHQEGFLYTNPLDEFNFLERPADIEPFL